MKKKFFTIAAFALLLHASGAAGIIFDVMPLASNQWQYSYDVINTSSDFIIEEFTVFFDADLYENISVDGIQPPTPQWDILVWNSAFAGSPGGYDALTMGNGILQGQTVSGFSVVFDWLGTGMPGSQHYEIVNPLNYNDILESGQTASNVIPAPGAFCLVLSGLAFLRFPAIKHRI